MPTTPNPTPPDEDDGGPTVPSSPVDPPPPPTNPDEEWLVHRPNVLDRGVSYPRAEINYVEKFMTVTNKVSFFQSFAATQYPHPPMFDGVCPGHWSRQYPDMGAAAALASGSGYFGYVGTGILNPDKWWSTNFVDDPAGENLPATAVTSKGQYHSKNSALAAEENITALVIVSKDTVSLKWGSSWGLVTKNSTYDRRAADGSIQPELHILPRSSDGSPDLEMLEKDIMNKAPVTGSFVIVDFKRNSYVFTTVDGAYAQYTAIDEKNRPTRDTMPFEQSALPLTSMMATLPFIPTVTSPTTVGMPNASVTTSPVGIVDRSKDWLQFVSGVVPAGYTSTYATKYEAQQPSTSYFAVNMTTDTTGKPWWSTRSINHSTDTWYDDQRFKVYSPYLVKGSNTQCVGLVTNTSLSGGSTPGTMVVSAYGISSTSPTAKVSGVETVLVPSPGGAEGILAVCPKIFVGFIYDASIGDYGQVKWISFI